MLRLYLGELIKGQWRIKIIKRIGTMKRRCKLFWAAINQNSVFAVVERSIPAYYYLSYDEDDIFEFHKEALRQVREMLNDFSD